MNKTLKNIMLALCLSTALAGPAYAGEPSQSFKERMNHWSTPWQPSPYKWNHFAFVCTPTEAPDKNDKDPLQYFHINADFLDDGSLIKLIVIGQTFKNKRHSRGEEYKESKLIKVKWVWDENNYAWGWKGIKKNHVAIGILIYEADNHHDDSGVIAPTIPEISRPAIPGLIRPPVPEISRPPIPELFRAPAVDA